MVEAPDRADFIGDGIAEVGSGDVLLVLVAGGEHDEVGRDGLAGGEAGALRGEAGDAVVLDEGDVAVGDEVGAADVEVVAAAAAEIHHLEAGFVFAEGELEAAGGERVVEGLVDLAGGGGGELVGAFEDGVGHGGGEEVAVGDGDAFVVDGVH